MIHGEGKFGRAEHPDNTQQAAIASCVDWMLAGGHFETEDARREFLLSLTPETFTDWSNEAAAHFLTEQEKRRAAHGEHHLLGAWALEKGGIRLLQAGIAVADQPEAARRILSCAQTVAITHPDRMQAAATVLSIGTIFAHMKADGNGREANRLWGALGHYGVHDTPQSREWYAALLHPDRADEVVRPGQVMTTLSQLHAHHTAQLLTEQLGLSEIPSGVTLEKAKYARDTPFELIEAREEMRLRASEQWYGLPGLLAYMRLTQPNSNAYIYNSQVRGDWLAAEASIDDVRLFMHVADEMKLDFLEALRACFEDGDESIFGPSSQIIHFLDASANAQPGGAVLPAEELPAPGVTEAVHDALAHLVHALDHPEEGDSELRDALHDLGIEDSLGNQET